MRVFTVDEVKQQRDEILRLMRSSVFVAPTDNIYAICCNAMIHKSVQRVRDIKSNFDRPFSIIAPSREWIVEHCIITKEAQAYLDQLPGPLTLMMTLKNKDILDPAVLNGSTSVSIRIPDHWISGLVAALGYPLVATSANLVGEPSTTSLDDLDEGISQKIDFFIDEGEKVGAPSTLVHLEKRS